MEFIDDHPVVSHQVRFKNRTDITAEQAQLVKDDLVVVWLVRARCQPPSYHPVGRDTAERYRFNVQAVEGAAPLDGDMRTQALAYLEHGPDQAYVEFGNPRFKQEDLFDAADYGPDAAEYQIAELARYLHDQGALDPDLSPVDNVRLLVEALNDEPKVIPAIQQLFREPSLLDDNTPGEVEVVGSIYSNGRRPASLEVLRKAFGDVD